MSDNIGTEWQGEPKNFFPVMPIDETMRINLFQCAKLLVLYKSCDIYYLQAHYHIIPTIL